MKRMGLNSHMESIITILNISRNDNLEEYKGLNHDDVEVDLYFEDKNEAKQGNDSK